MNATPITLLTGFLGAGKSTLLSHVLRGQTGRRVAVIQNEANNLGLERLTSISADGESTDNGWIDLPNGCVCCTVKDDLLVALEQLLAVRHFDHIIIELSGLADPAPLVQIFWSDRDLEASVFLDAVVCLCDAQHILHHLETTREAAQQIALADRIILNKCDLVSPQQADLVAAQLLAVNGSAPIIRSVRANTDLQLVLNIHAFDPKRTAERLFQGQESTSIEPQHGRHSNDISTVRITIHGALDKTKLRAFLASLLWETEGQDYDVLRLKGLITLSGKQVKYALQGVRDIWSLEKTAEPVGPDDPTKGAKSDFVFIGRKLRMAAWEKELQLCTE